ncbi:MAG: type II toxin-antitoxin system Phd/YefM family antitoxin [Tepidisphaeraceae bacterium]
MTWNLSEAKNKLSEVLDRVEAEGPQTIERRGERFVVVAAHDYEKRTGRAASFKAWLMSGPSLGGVDLERDRSRSREIKL